METKIETRGRKKGYRKPDAKNDMLPIRVDKKIKNKAILAAAYLELNLAEEIRNLLLQIIERADTKSKTE